MDRQIVYPGQIPLETDLLNTNRNAMVALGKLIGDVLGTSTLASGLACTPTGPATLNVLVGPGEIYSLQNLDGTAYSSLSADTTHQVMKQGILLDAVTLACAAPSTAGYSINYLIEATYQDVDAVSVALPYYNASNPTQAYTGPANSGASQSTVRKGSVVVLAKAGIAAATGTQTTPAADAGYVGLWAVTVANGQATITAPNIVQATAAPFIGSSLSAKANSADLALSTGAGLVGSIGAVPGSLARTAQSKFRDIVSVKDFGAAGDGVTDDTAAFNLATQSTTAWAAGLQYDIHMPSGPGIKYKLNGTVYVRKGQSVRGSGHGTYVDCSGAGANPTFSLGNGFIGGVSTADAGGSPVKIENFFTYGGSSTRGAIYSNAQGFEINSVFMSAAGTGIELNGAADGLVSNLEIDQSLSAISMTACQNIAFSNANIYLPNYGVVFNADCRDIVFNGGVIEYPQYAGVLFNDSVSNIKGIAFDGTLFTMNAQYATFLGYVYSRANYVEAQFTGCSFRNMYNWAVNHAAGAPVALTFSGCVFDGNKTATAYTQSTTAKALNTGVSGTYNFLGCEFRNLLGEIATINDNLSKLNLIGGIVVNCDANAVSQKRFNVVTLQVPKITVKSLTGFGYVFTSGSNQCMNLPWWGASTVWKVSIKGDTQNVGDAYYSSAEEAIYAVTWMNATATKSINVDKMLLWKTPTRTNPGDLGAVACLGVVPGGVVTTTTFAATGSICVSVPTSSASNFDFYAETAT